MLIGALICQGELLGLVTWVAIFNMPKSATPGENRHLAGSVRIANEDLVAAKANELKAGLGQTAIGIIRVRLIINRRQGKGSIEGMEVLAVHGHPS